MSDTAAPELDRLSPLSADELRTGPAAVIASGPVLMRLRTDNAGIWRDVARMYAGYPGTVADSESLVADFTVEFRTVRHPPLFGTRRLAFRVNGGPVLSMQKDVLGFALFEWGANWCVSQFSQSHLLIHAAVVERNGRALILPGPPGSGKSTLCATLVSRGWRLLTDETAMFRLDDGLLDPVVRPVSLKNRAIDVMQALWPDGLYGRRIDDTDKGTVAHLRAPEDSIARMYEPAPGHAVIFPTFVEGAKVSTAPYDKAAAFMFLASNSFNYDVLGQPAFDCLSRAMQDCAAAAMSYGDGTAAAEAIEAMWP